MNKIIAIIALALVFGFGFVVANAYAGGGMTKGWHRPYEVGEILGSHVKNLQREDPGRIHDFVIDSNGRIAFGILAYGGFMEMGEKLVAIPFSALTYDPIQKHLVLDINREKLESAPSFERSEPLNLKWAEILISTLASSPTGQKEDILKGQVSPWYNPIGSISECGQSDGERRFSLAIFS